MEKKIVESHRDLLHAILVIGTMVIFFGFLGTFIIFYIAAQYDLPKRIFLTFLGLGANSFAILSLRHYFNDVPKIIISTTAITIKTLFNKREISLADIENVGLNQKSPMTIVYLAVDMESTIIHSKQFGEIFLWDHYYKNINQLKFILERIADKVRNGDLNFDELANLKPKPKAIVNKINPNDLRLENFKEYKGNIFLNFNSVMFFSILAITLVYFDINRIGASLAIDALFYGLMGYQSNYFLLSDNYLQVRNYLWFWKKTTYRLTDIHEVILEMPGKLSESARIVLKSYSTSLNPAGSLKTKDWIELINDLEQRGVKVRDELYLRD